MNDACDDACSSIRFCETACRFRTRLYTDLELAQQVRPRPALPVNLVELELELVGVENVR
eukprot:9500826-Pyramimonas_sp.AAC.1